MHRAWGWLGLVGAAGIALGVGALRHPPRLAVPDRNDLVLADVTIVEPAVARRTGRTVVVHGGRIARVAAGRPDEPRGPFAGTFVLPGLVDLHVHHPPRWALGERELFALLFLAHGVTSVRDTGETGGSLAGHARAIAEGRLAGPRVLYCGPVLDGEPPVWPTARTVPDAAAAREAVEALAADGASCVKVYNRLSRPALREVLDEARRHGLRVVAHVPEASSLAELGGAEVQHFTGLTKDWWDVTDARLAWYAGTSVELGIAHTPTFVAFDRHARLADYDALASDPAARWLPAYHREILWNPRLNPLALRISPSGGSTVANRLPVMRRLLGGLVRRGAAVGVGSDTGSPFVVPGDALHGELRQWVAAGLSPERVWAAATRGGGRILGIPGLGTLAEGAPADLLVFREDPTRDLAALASLEAVVADGRLYRIDALRAALERQRDHFARPWIDAPSRLAARLLVRRLERREADAARGAVPRP